MSELLWFQYLLIAAIFIWSGFVRSGLGFGGNVLSLPFLLLVDDRPLVYLPLIAVHLLVFSSLTVYLNHRKAQAMPPTERVTTVDWHYLKFALAVMLVPKLMGVVGLIKLPADIMTAIIFCIIAVYSVSYILNKPFRSNSRVVDILFLMVGAYISGTSLIGAPLVVAVFANHVARHQLRDTLFVLWFILVTIKMAAFIYVGVDLQWVHHLWLLPCAAVGHVLGLRLHDYMLRAETSRFFRILGSALLLVSLVGLVRVIT
ncbi:sulfite exporter TauE/SafE family protein [Exilibacterium tricleocarpae]|uniref:Probable membrane transporter protein n=1 Tax=Exilibacterium tricleocarpae TaxID=2591008 RepID=A0A545SY66_9GAMM|nr:TSUP family transporter [Exilibacterium tricleocarpae]TQV69879.1 sulfite exporter TauE/SafE family protein [Exilibacterium tricleocarpae]